MVDIVFGIKVGMSGLCINRYRPIIGRFLDADYRPADNPLLPYRCISTCTPQFKNCCAAFGDIMPSLFLWGWTRLLTLPPPPVWRGTSLLVLHCPR